MATPERLNWELRNSQGEIVGAFVDHSVAEACKYAAINKGTQIYECQYPVTHRGWFYCDFSPYFDPKNPSPKVIINGTVYVQARTELEVNF